MKAAVYKKYGSPDEINVVDIEKPTPKKNEILVKVKSTTVTTGDVRLRSSNFPKLFWLPARIIFGLFSPKKTVLGHEFSGIVEEIGAEITKFKVGDKVFGTTTLLNQGSHAEYVCIPQEWKSGVVELMPNNTDFNNAAAMPIGAMTALFLLEKANYSEKGNVLIYGASGSVGSFAIQFAKEKGLKVTAVCSNKNFKKVKELGADETIDYHTKDYSTLNDKFDIVFDAVGYTTKKVANSILSTNGIFITVEMMTKEKSENLLKIKTLSEENKLKAQIDKIFNLDQIREAHKYVDSGRKVGNIIIEVN